MTATRSSARTPVDVLLVSMPFGPVFWPSIGLGLLRAGLARRGVSSRVRYFTIRFAEQIGERLYDRVAMSSTLTVRELAGEWVFSGTLFDQTDTDVTRYVDRILIARDGYLTATPPVPASMRRSLLGARARAAAFLDRCLADILADEPRIVGFTSVFQQHVASLALARRLKAARPGIFVVIGGANCEGAMGAETIRQFPWIDAVVSGEADVVFPELVRRVLDGSPVEGLPGVRTRATVAADFAAGVFPSAPPVRDMDGLPVPDYDDYFEQFRASRFARDWDAGVFVETSRGCWWGERQHCTFCGLNGATMTYRSKSPGRALDELMALRARHPNADIQVVDNILDLGYMKTLLPELARRNLDFGLFYETKSNLKQEQVKLLRDAGVRTIQPGIESLSDPVLKLMRKGVSALQNIQALKWCKQYGVQPLWNLMWGFPGEPPAEYEAMARLVPHLAHLPPPAGSFGLRLDRFSPNFDRPEAFGFDGVAPLHAYAHVYPFSRETLANLAYYFQFSYRDRHPETYVRPLLDALAQWPRRYRTSELLSIDLGTELLVCDLRAGRRARLIVLRGVERLAHLMCESIATEDQLLDGLAGARGGDAADAVHAALAALVDRDLVVQMGRRYLAVALPFGEHQPAPAILRRIETLVRRAGYRLTRPRPAAAHHRLTADQASGRQGALGIG